MIKLDLVTGFLGSGKTTFIHAYAKYIKSLGYHVGIIINDLGAVNIDMLFLSDLEKEGIEVLQVTSCCPGDENYKRRFITKLINLKLRGYDYFIAEPSGAFDINTFLDIVNDDRVESFDIVPGIICIVDPNLLLSSEENIYLSQLATSSKAVITRMDGFLPDVIQKRITELFRKNKINRLFLDSNIIYSKKADFSDVDFEKLLHASCYSEYLNVGHDEYESMFFMEPIEDDKTIIAKASLLLEDKTYGEIIRVKGFIKNKENYKEINFTKNERMMKDSPSGQNVLIVVGKDLDKERIGKLFPVKLGL